MLNRSNHFSFGVVLTYFFCSFLVLSCKETKAKETKASPGASAKISQKAPDFSLKDTYGKEHRLSSYKGRYVVLEWLNHECPFVKKHYVPGNMQSLQKEFTGKGVAWFSINSSAKGKQGHFSLKKTNALTKKKNAFPTAVLIDAKGEVGKLYGAKTTPHMFVIDPEGVLIYAGAIDSIDSSDAEDIPKATNYVLTALNASMSGQPVATPNTPPYGCSVKY